MMDPNHWPAFMWLVIALGFGSVVTSILLFLWRAIFGRRPGWILDSVLLGASGFVLVFAMMAYLSLVGERVPKGWRRFLGEVVLAGLALLLAWGAGRIRKWSADSRRMRTFGSAKGEFTVPDDFNDPLPKDVEDQFYNSQFSPCLRASVVNFH